MLLPIDELARVASSIWIGLNSNPILHSIDVFASVNLAVNPRIGAISASQTILHVSIVNITVLEVGSTSALASTLLIKFASPHRLGRLSEDCDLRWNHVE